MDPPGFGEHRAKGESEASHKYPSLFSIFSSSLVHCQIQNKVTKFLKEDA